MPLIAPDTPQQGHQRHHACPLRPAETATAAAPGQATLSNELGFHPITDTLCTLNYSSVLIAAA